MLRAGDEPILGYKLLEFLGRGQFGQVWKSTAPGGGLAALKFLDLSGRQGWKEFRGIQRVKQIRHAHLMPITALWLLDDAGNVLGDTVDEVFQQQRDVSSTLAADAAEPRLLIVAQLLGDKTLMNRMQECQQAGHAGVPREELLPYMQDAAKGIDFLNSATHDLGEGLFAVQHCDIKPDNMLLAGDSVLVCDFGVAQVLADGEDDTKATGMVGSLAYMSPECATRQPSKTSDQYSLAISYYELVTGELPFLEQNQVAVLDAHRTGNLHFDKVAPAEREVLKRATSVDPRQRFSSCAEMVNALRLAGVAPGPAVARRKTSLIPLAAVVCLAFVLGFLAYQAIRPKDGPARTARTYTVSIVPADAEVYIDGERLQPNETGELTFDHEPTATIQLTASKPPDFRTEQIVVDLRTHFDNPVINIRLEPSAKNLAESSWRQLQEIGRSDQVVRTYMKAIELDGSYSQLPSAMLLMQPESATATMIRTAKLLELNQSGAKLVAGCSDGALLVWEVVPQLSASYRLLHAFPQRIQSLAVGERLAAAADFENQVAIVALNEDQPLISVEGASGVIELAISRDDQTLLLSSDADRVKVVRAYGIRDGKLTAPQLVATHEQTISRIAFLADGSGFITASWDDTVKRWRFDQPNEGVAVATLSGDVLCLDRQASWLAVGGDGRPVDARQDAPEYQVLLVSLDGGKQIELDGGHDDVITNVALHANGQWVASASADGAIRVWALRDGKAEARIVPNHHQRAVNALAFHPLDDWLFSAADDGTVVLWDLPTGRFLIVDQVNGSALTLAVSPDGRWLFAAGEDGTIRAIDLQRCWLIKQACDELKQNPLPPPKPASTVQA